MNDQPRLIEVAFPLRQASLTSVHEKNVRPGHISTLHIWPARRPLAACRAALLATLLPDPGNHEERRALLEKIGGTVVKKSSKETDADGKPVTVEKDGVQGGVLAWKTENTPAMAEFRKQILDYYGGVAPKVLDPFAGGGAIPLEAMRLGCEVTASDINPVAWFLLKNTLDYPQRCAGKKWPLPDFVRNWPDFIADFTAGKVKKRRGANRPHFSDPKQLALFDLPDADLSWQVRAWGRWVLERARAELTTRYPMVNGEPTVAYLWARTARDKETLGRIPLLKTFWLSRKKKQRVAILPSPKADKSGVDFVLLNEDELAKLKKGGTRKLHDKYPWLKLWEVEAATLEEFLNHGTMNRAGVWSPVSGRPGLVALTMDELRRQGQMGLLGTQMTAVVVEASTAEGITAGKKYRLPVAAELKGAEVEPEDLDEVFKDIPFGIPDEPTPAGGGSGASRAFSVQKYGMKKWRDLFTPRQLLSLGVFVKHSRAAFVEIEKHYGKKDAEALSGILVIFFGRFVDYMSMQCRWESKNGEVKNTMSRFALPMIWDYSEANPLASYERYYVGGISVATRVISHLLEATQHATNAPELICRSVLSDPLPKQQIIFTDPPYYDAIPYSDLMDFFFIWQKRLVGDLNDEMKRVFGKRCAPKWDNEKKDGELIEDESRHGGNKVLAKKAYEDGMTGAFVRCREALADDGRFVVVFANKDVDAWETLASALVRSGFVVTTSWPIQTEMPNKVTQKRANLSSSVWIVCRKRSAAAQPGWEDQVLAQMRDKLFTPRETLGGRNILQYFFDLGIRGPDFIWAALGPALEAYSAHPFVKKTAGGIMTVPEFLGEVRRLVLQFSLGELPGFRDIQRETQGRGAGVELDPVTQYYLLHRAFFALESAPAGACILYANACGKNETELKVVWNILAQGGKGKHRADDDDDDDEAETGKGNEYRLVDWAERAKAETLGAARAGSLVPLIDRVHRLMFLFQQNRVAEMKQSFDAWGLANERAFPPLLQAVQELAKRDSHDTERQLVEALMTQLKLQRVVTVQETLPNTGGTA